MSYKYPFIGIVNKIVDLESEELEAKSNNELVDNRFRVWVKPLEDMGALTSVECFFSNYSSLDLPLPNEAVLVIPTNIGNIIVDRLVTNASNLNFDPKTPLLGATYSNIESIKTITIPDRQKKYINKTQLENNPPFISKVGAKYELGRNGQYLIFDSKKRLNSPLESDGDFVKVGIRRDEKSEESFEDNHIFITKNENVKRFMQVTMDSKYIPSEEDMGDGGIGISGDNTIFYGKRYIVLFSKENLILRSYKKILLEANEEIGLYSSKVSVDAKETVNIKAKETVNIKAKETVNIKAKETVNIEGNEVNIGDGADEPLVRGNELKNMLEDVIGLIDSLKMGIITNPATFTSTTFTPDVIIKIELLKRKYLNTNSPILSKKGFTE